jgi:hypothetical protein
MVRVENGYSQDLTLCEESKSVRRAPTLPLAVVFS